MLIRPWFVGQSTEMAGIQLFGGYRRIRILAFTLNYATDTQNYIKAKVGMDRV